MASKLIKESIRIATWLPVGLMLGSAVASIHQVTGTSMFPTLGCDSTDPRIHTSTYVVLNRAAFRSLGHRLVRGDVVALRDPQDPTRLLIKRVVGLPGDEVLCNPGDLSKTQEVKKGMMWIEGDNLDHSIDSRVFGLVPQGLVVGRVDVVIWPQDQARFLFPRPDLTRVILPNAETERT